MNRFLWGGWVARPSAFYFVAFLCLPCLILFGLVAMPFFVGSAFRCRLTCSQYSLFQLVARVLSCLLSRRCLTVQVPSIPSIPALLGYYLTLNEKHALLIYALLIHFVT